MQIGGRTPERIPEIGARRQDGRLAQRRGRQAAHHGALSGRRGAARQVASVAGGKIVRSERGTTGIDTIAQDLKRKMTEELAEHVETIYADVYFYPLGAALVLLVAEVFLPESGRRRSGTGTGTGTRTGDRQARAGVKVAGLLGALAGAGAGGVLRGRSSARRRRSRAPSSRSTRAMRALRRGCWRSTSRPDRARKEASAFPEKVRDRPYASLDLGIALFHMGERFGRRFGEEERGGEAGPTPEEQALAELRNTEVECALRVVLAIAGETDVPLDLRARAHYLAGNLEFLRKGYEEAVRHYDESLKLIPGIVDGGDTIGQDAAWNRAIALFRIEEEKKRDAGAPDGSGETGPHDASDDRKSSPDGQPENQDGGGHDPKPDGGAPPPKDAGGGASDARPTESRHRRRRAAGAAAAQREPR